MAEISLPLDLELADLDSDNDLDVVVSGIENGLILENIGTEFNVHTAEVNGLATTTADYDGDGKIDVASTEYEWLKNDSIDIIIRADRFQTKFGSFNSHVTDLDLDGDLDVGVVGEHNLWLRNSFDEADFAITHAIIDDYQGSRFSTFVDLDGDGDDDLVNSVSAGFTWVENENGEGIFGPSRLISDRVEGSGWVGSADLDSDGDLDLVGSTEDRVIWFENLYGDGRFSRAREIHSEPARYGELIDWDGDGDTDLLLAVPNQLKLLQNEGTTNLFGSAINLSNSDADFVTAVDFDRDGDRDIFYDNFNTTLHIVKNLGDHGSVRMRFSNKVGFDSLAIADFDDDGDVDVVGANEVNEFFLFENKDGVDTFELVFQLNTPFAVHIDSTGDLDGDGDLDIIASIDNDQIGGLIMFENTWIDG